MNKILQIHEAQCAIKLVFGLDDFNLFITVMRMYFQVF